MLFRQTEGTRLALLKRWFNAGKPGSLVFGRARLVESLCAAAVIVALASLPLHVAPEISLVLAPPALMLVALLFGAWVTVVTTSLVALGILFVPAASFDPITGPFAALLGACLVNARVHPGAAAIAYGIANLGALLLQSSASLPAPRQAALALFGAVVSFATAAAWWSLLPERLRNLRRHQRKSFSQLVFSVSLAMMLWSGIIVTWRANVAAAAGVPPRELLDGLSLLPMAAAAIVLSTWLQHAVRNPILRLGTSFASAARAPRSTRRLSLRELPDELARLVLPLWRRLRHLGTRAQRLNRQAAAAHAENEKLRTMLLQLKKRMQEQSHTLLLAQQRDTKTVQTLEKAVADAHATIERVRGNRNLFIAMMSHEVRTPLHGLMSTLSLLREESLSEEGVRRLDIARASARSLLKIANDILDLSRIDTGGFSFESKPFDPRELVSEVVENYQAMARAQHLSLEQRIADSVPVALIGDRDRIYQIISNLVANAVKFTATGGVTIRASWKQPQIVFDVIDTGRGVPQDRRESIFDSFVQVEASYSRRFTGTGLGLTISRYLAEGMGGSLRLHDTGPQGSTFRLSLALEACDEPVLKEQSNRVLANPPTGRILVVEDNDANQYVARVLLESLGCTVDIVGTGAAALEIIARERFDLILMDCQLPRMDGYKTTRRLRAVMRERIPVIAMTANALPEDKARCAQAGMDDFLAKPFTKATLSLILGQWLGGGEYGLVQSPAAESGEGKPVLDGTVFEELRESLHWSLTPLKQIYDAFMDNARNTIALLSAQRPTPPAPQILRSLHTLRGSASMVGAKRIAHIAGLLEHAAQNQKLDPAGTEATALPKALREFERALDERLSDLVRR